MENLRMVKSEYPVIFQCMYDILEYEKQVLGASDFLSEAVNNLFLGILDFNNKFIQLAEQLDGSDPPKPTQPPAMAEVWPNYPPHTEEENFFADKSKDTGETKVCNKDYPEDAHMTGGIGHITCRNTTIISLLQAGP